jgi:cholesterol transport system auxiliary component
LGLAGCAALPSPPVAVQTFLLSVPYTGPRGGVGPLLLVTMPRATAGYERPGIAYRRSPTRLDYYAESEWADEPARLLEPLLVAAIEASGGFEAVVSMDTGIGAALRLDTEILRLDHDLVGSPGRGRVSLRARLIDVARGRVLATRVFDASVPSPSDNAEGAVAAINSALARVLGQVVALCLDSD